MKALVYDWSEPAEPRSDVHRWYHTLEMVRRDRTFTTYLEKNESQDAARAGTFRQSKTNRRMNRAEYKRKIKGTTQVSALRKAISKAKSKGAYVGHWLHPELDTMRKGKRWAFRHNEVRDNPKEKKAVIEI